MANTSLESTHSRSRIRTITGWTIFFMVVLRVGIGWHFLYEGVWKLKDGNFSATPYLLASAGPLKPIFRSMVFDADGFKRMDPKYQIGRLDEAYDRIVAHYDLTDEQKKTLDDFRKAQKDELTGLTLSNEAIAKIKGEYVAHVSSVVTGLGDGIGPVASVAVKPKDSLTLALSRMQSLNVSQLPVFDEERLVGIVKEPDSRSATSKPQGTSETLVKDVMIPDTMANKDYARALTADDYHNAIESYVELLKQVAYEETHSDPKFRAERRDFNQKKVSTARSALLVRIEKPVTSMELVGEPLPPGVTRKEKGIPELSLTTAQLNKGPLPPAHLARFPGNLLNKLKFPPKTLTFWIDVTMIFGLIAIGACLVLGLFTRFAAFCGVLMLAMFYFSMPPWPGLTDPPNVEGHYLIVNKNLIEMIALLMIMSSGIGRWFGLDAFRCARKERCKRRREERDAQVKDTVVVTSRLIPQGKVYVPETIPLEPEKQNA